MAALPAARLALLAAACATAVAAPQFEPTVESLKKHQLPAWFDDAKLGMMVHWTPASVPAFAPLTEEDPATVVSQHGFGAFFGANPYAEWYENSLRIPGSAVYEHHRETYGPGYDYHRFGRQLERAAADAFSADAWAALAQDAGARYVVMVTKHHDGYTLWPTAHRPPTRPDFGSDRDFVGEVTDAVRARGMRMGLYYSGGLDWTFDATPITDAASLLAAAVHTSEYGAYADAHVRELIDRYQPSVLWGDIGYPSTGRWRAILASYYNAIPDGVVNNRFGQTALPKVLVTPGSVSARVVSWCVDQLAAWTGGLLEPPSGPHDFSTPEYSVHATASRRKWESVRGLTSSFGYNRNDGPDTHIAATALVHLLADVVAKNGNLLINIGPMANGTVPAPQAERLRELGAWLRYAGPAIYGTRTTTRPEATDAVSGVLQFRCTYQPADGALYAILLGRPEAAAAVALPHISAVPLGFGVDLLTPGGALPCTWTHDAAAATVHIALPTGSGADVTAMPALVFRLRPAPKPSGLTFAEFVEEARMPMIFATVATLVTMLFIWLKVEAAPAAAAALARPAATPSATPTDAPTATSTARAPAGPQTVRARTGK